MNKVSQLQSKRVKSRKYLVTQFPDSMGLGNGDVFIFVGKTSENQDTWVQTNYAI